MRKRKLQRKVIILVTEIVVLFILLLYLFIVKNKYENIFYKNTIINGEDCSFLTTEEAMDVIQKKVQNYTLEIVFKDNEKEYISAKEIGLTINNLKAKLNDIKEQQRKNLFLKGGTYNFNDLAYNYEKLESILLEKRQLQTSYMEEKTELKYEFNPDSKLFEITKQNDYYLDYNEVLEEVSTAIEKGTKSVELQNLYQLPENSQMFSNIKELNEMISAKITYQLPNGKEYILDATTLHNWLTQNEDGSYQKDDEVWNKNIEDFVTNELSIMANTIDVSREFKPTDKDITVLVNGGNYGYRVNEKAEIEQLKSDLENCLVIERKPCYATEEVSIENNGLGNSYVEIDITRQKVWVYVDGILKIETDCVTGCVNKEHATPTGIFTLSYKEKDRILRGKMLPNGKREYESHVNYWMPFNGGIGLHDATWRKTFGGDIYITKGSHGCINLPYEKAGELYNIINENMPIIVYES